MALVTEEPKKKFAVLTDKGTAFVWDYQKKNPVIINKENIPAISISNNPEDILNKEAISFPKDFDQVAPIEEPRDKLNEQEKLSNLGRREESELLQEFNYKDEDDDDEQSILIQKLREHVIRFEKLLTKYLDPDIPTGRKAKRKFFDERELFRVTGYKDFINAIDLKVDALCSFEGYKLAQFCKGDEKNWFKGRIAKALGGDFYSAQEVVNSVMQIVKQEEYAYPKRRIVSKLK